MIRNLLLHRTNPPELLAYRLESGIAGLPPAMTSQERSGSHNVQPLTHGVIADLIRNLLLHRTNPFVLLMYRLESGIAGLSPAMTSRERAKDYTNSFG